MENIYLIFDTETTGIPLYDGTPLDDSKQPDVTQIAAQLIDEQGNILDEMCVYIKPTNWTVPEHITKLTGVTTEILEANGIPIEAALTRFNEMKDRATLRVAHNAGFDKTMLKIAAVKASFPHQDAQTPSICTMKLTKDICRIPQKNGALKNPKLGEAYSFFFNEPMNNAHDAMGDVVACAKVFFAAKKYLEQQGVAV